MTLRGGTVTRIREFGEASTVESSDWRDEKWRRDARAKPATVRCSFCGKRREDVQGIVTGPTPEVAICTECVELAGEILAPRDERISPPKL